MHKEKYGRLTILTLKRLMKAKLITITVVNDCIYRKIVNLFFHTLEPTSFFHKSNYSHSKASQNNVKIKKIISCFPSFKAILKRINSPDFNDEKNKNELLFIKLVLDLQHKFYLDFDYPLYKVALNNFRTLSIRIST